MKQSERIAWAIVVLALMVWNQSGNGRTDSGGKSGRSDVAEAEASPRHRERNSLPERIGARPRRERPGGEIVGRSGSIRSRSLNALRSVDPVARMAAFLQVLSSCDAADVGEVTEALEEMKASGISLPGEEELLHRRAGQLAGADLLAGRTGTAEDFAVMGALKQQYEGWIQADSHAAGDWLNQLPPGKFRDQMAVAYIAANTKDDPQGTMNLVATLHPSQQAAAGGAVVTSATLQDSSALLRTLEANPGDADSANGRYLETIFTALADKVASGNDPAAVSLIEEHLDQTYVSSSALTLVSAAKAKFDPEGALDWAVNMEIRRPQSLNHGQAVSSVIQAMSLEDLETAEGWAATRPDADVLLHEIERRKETLQDRQGEDNEYDRDD